MRAFSAVLACSLVAAATGARADTRAAASAEAGQARRATGAAPAEAAPDGDGAPVQVIGGSAAKAGAWPDVAAILFPLASGEQALCTGTLIAPTVVLTAGHCYDPLVPPLPDHVLIGTSSLARPDEGETIAIRTGHVYPSAETTEDLAVLVLAKASSRPPRKIATGWARTDLINGAQVALVGFGAIDADAARFVDELQVATSAVTDADCSVSSGCNAAARPRGELGAGGMGIDTCPGDSGGPLYLLTGYGPVLAGVTSRSYDDAQRPCSDGGIYVRPDKVIDWIDQVAGVRVAQLAAPTADRISAVHGDGGDTRIAVNDPASDDHTFELTTPPAHGTALVRSDGAVRVCVDPAASPGDDQLTVTITDRTRPLRSLALAIAITIEDGTPPARCDVTAFSEAGCCDARGHAGSAIPLALAVLGMIRRRRRCPASPAR